MKQFANFLLISSVMICAACNAPNREQPPTQFQRNLDQEKSALQLAQTCSAAADTFWRLGGYDKPTAPAKGTTENWGYQSHYNAEQKRCYVLAEVVTMLPGGRSTQYKEVYDAIEGGEPLAILNIVHNLTDEEAQMNLLRGNRAIPLTTENLEWFRGLMTK